MKKIIVGTVVGAWMLLGTAAANNVGQSVFESNGCVMCHKPNMEGVGPSLQQIGMHYSGKENALVSYLKGETQAIIYPERAAVMQPQLVKIRNLYEDEVRSLARYLITPQF